MKVEHKKTLRQRYIKTAILEILKKETNPLAPKEVYEKIISEGLYNFKAKNPISLISTELRSYCKGVNTSTSKEPKLFEMVDGKYRVLS
ncbi:MAG: hypothetical protein H7A24_16525 [Leptospiraceae bacterium]|nr:hypothetical protein [Leptospiraceae bacterium]MCP5513495.1 hypothetical protein [Leptospiraceae bacterium]